jgi:hypothetical protein
MSIREALYTVIIGSTPLVYRQLIQKGLYTLPACWDTYQIYETKWKKPRERSRLENLRIPCLEEIRQLAYPHFSFTRGRVKNIYP